MNLKPIQLTLSLLFVLTLPTASLAEPFVVEDMPAEFDGSRHGWHDARRPVMADFNGDGQPSWYAGGNHVAHPKAPTAIDPLRFSTTQLPTITPSGCSNCSPRYLAFAVADFDRDGQPDIARINDWTAGNDFSLQVFEGNGSNGFNLGDRRNWTSSIGSSLGDCSIQMRAADYDNDGDLDLAILSVYQQTDTAPNPDRERGSLVIRWNTNGAFSTETALQSQDFEAVSRLLSGDFDRDGDIDLIASYQVTYNATTGIGTFITRVFTNQGGAFTASSDPSFDDIQSQQALAMVDIDRDSHPEWLGWRNGSLMRRVYVPDTGWQASFLNYANVQGNGASYHTVQRSFAVAVADFDDNGSPDVITAEGPTSGDPRNLVLHRNNGNGVSTSSEIIASFPSSIMQIGFGDARGDTDQDLLIRLRDGSFRFVRNTAQRLEPVFQQSVLDHALTGLTKLGVGDSNRDGKPDVFALKPQASGSHMELFLGTGSDAFLAPEFKILANTPSDFALGDFNRDGRLDYAYTVPNTDAVRTVLQSDNIFFSWPDSTIATYDGAALIEAGNVLSYDGITDLFVASTTTGGLLALRSDGTSWSDSNPRTSFASMPNALTTLPRYSGLGDAPIACAVDGLTYQMQAYSVAFGWSKSAEIILPQTAGQSGLCSTANLDSDADKEMVFVNGNGALSWWDPVLSAGSIVNVIDEDPPSVNAITTIDANSDGLDDLLLGGPNGVVVYIRAGLTDSWRKLELPGGIIKDLVAVDINRDGLLDIVSSTPSGLVLNSNISTVLGAGAHTFPLGSDVSASPGQTLQAIDLNINNPGRLDEDASIALTSARVSFRKVAYSGGMPQIGLNMTGSEVQQAVASVSILMDGQVIGTMGTASVTSQGELVVPYSSVLGNLVPIAAGSEKALQFRIALKATAGSASYSEFYLQTKNVAAGVIHPGNVFGRSSSIDSDVSVRVQISQNLFSNGFE